MLVSERMKNAEFLEPNQTLATAARRLRKDNIGCLPVCQDGRVLGMITDRDIAMRGVADNRDPNRMRVSDAMSLNAICCSKESSVEEAVALMRQAHVQRLAVVDADRRLVGIISMSDLEEGGSERRPFEVTFYKNILDHAGLPHHSELMRVSVAQGTKDEAVDYSQALRTVELFKKIGVPCDLITIQDGIHGVINWEKEPRFQSYKPQMIAWLHKTLGR